MKWGIRKERVSQLIEKTKNEITHPILATRAGRDSLKGKSFGTKMRRTIAYQTTAELTDVNKRVKVMTQAQKQAKINRALGKAQSTPMASMTPEQMERRRGKMLLLGGNILSAAANTAFATYSKNPTWLRVTNASVAVGNVAATGSLIYDLKTEKPRGR
jgi:hypothetical protein